MVNYAFATEEQIELANEARKILEKELVPQIQDLEKADGGKGKYPMDVHKKLSDAGFYGMDIPEEYGGLGLDIVTRAIIAEEMAQIDAGFAFSFFSSNSYNHALLASNLQEDVKRDLMYRITTGEAIGSFGLTEADAGSDAAAMRTSAVKDGNEWVITGTKCFASNAPIANYFLILAWTDKTKRAREGVTMFIVEKERGIEIGKKEDKMGLKLSETSDIILDGVRVPEDHIIGEIGNGFGLGLSIINDEGRSFGLSYNVGLAQAALDRATEYAKERRQFGKRIIDHQGIGFMIADMEARTRASRAFLYETLERIKAGQKIGHTGNLLKAYISDNTMQTTLDAVQVLGGYGYMKDYPVEKLMRDAKIFQIFSGTNQIQRKNAARSIAGRDPQKK